MDLVNVQPIENKMGIINYVKYTAGSTQGVTTVGDEFASTFNYTGSDQYYTSQTVDQQPLSAAIASTVATLTLPWYPVIPGSVVISVGTGTPTVYHDDGAGNILNSSNETVSNCSINYSTGIVTMTTTQIASADTAVIGNWGFNNEYAPVDVPQIDLRIESIPVLAKSRKLKALWSFDASYELQKEYGQDLNALIAAQAAAEIAHEIDTEILNDLYNQAYVSVTQPAITWSAAAPYGVSEAQHFESLKTAFNKASNRIFQNTKRAMGNFVVVGTNVATVLESTPSFTPSGLGNNIGPYFLGTWGGFKVYKNPFYAPNNFLVGYKGNSLFDAGYAYCPYMPVATTQMLMLADFKGMQSWAASYAKTMLNSYMYVPGCITNFA